MRKHEKAIEEELKVITDLSSYKPWSGAVDTYEKISEAGKLDELEAYLEELFPDGLGMTQLNDILWFDSDRVLDALGLEHEPYDESLNESQSQEIAQSYKNLSKLHGVDLEDLVYGEGGFMKSRYPNGFPDFAGDIIYSEKY